MAWRTGELTPGYVQLSNPSPYFATCLLFYLDMGNRRKSWTLFCEHYVVSLLFATWSHYNTVNVALVPILNI